MRIVPVVRARQDLAEPAVGVEDVGPGHRAREVDLLGQPRVGRVVGVEAQLRGLESGYAYWCCRILRRWGARRGLHPRGEKARPSITRERREHTIRQSNTTAACKGGRCSAIIAGKGEEE